MSSSHKRPIPPRFTRESAQRAQSLSVAARRATDDVLRRELADMLGAIGGRLRRAVVAALPIRKVEAIRLEATRARRP